MLKFVRPEVKYTLSYWQAVDAIAREKKYLAATRAYPFDSTIELVNLVMENQLPQLFVIDVEKDICVGWCDALPKDEESVGYIGTGLLKEYRECGVGTALLAEIIAMSREHGYRRLELDVRASNKRAIHVYEKLGFRQFNVVKGGFVHGENTIVEDVVQMELPLDCDN